MTALALFRTRLRLFVVPLLAVGALVASAQQALACEVIGENGEPRPCTFTERFGKCLTEAEESARACDASGEGVFVCGGSLFIDRMACVWESIGGLITIFLD